MQIRSLAAEQTATNVKLARERLAELEAVLALYAGSADRDRCNWGHAGETGHIAMKLGELLGTFGPDAK